MLADYEQQLTDSVAEGVLTQMQTAALSAAAFSAALESPCDASTEATEAPSKTTVGMTPKKVYAFGLDAGYPDPSVGRATVGFTLAETTEVRLVVYDVMGREMGAAWRAGSTVCASRPPRALPRPGALRSCGNCRTAGHR